jgi:hypothetical protein
MQPNIVPGRKTEEERVAIMQQVVRDLAFRGYRIVAVDGARALVVSGSPVNHVLHAILSIFTCGLWLLMWALLAALGGETRRHIYIDDYGNVIWPS